MDREQLIRDIIIHNDNNICGFFNEFRFLSNMYPCKIFYHGIEYPSTENAYQAFKFTDVETRLHISSLTPTKSKLYARENKRKWDRNFDSFKLNLMIEINRIKFGTEPFLTALQDTEDKYLEETNYWKDKYWGVFEGEGFNHLGKILMDIRNENNGNPTKFNLYKPKGLDLDIFHQDKRDEGGIYFDF